MEHYNIVWYLFKVKNKDNRTTSSNFDQISHCCGVSTIDSEQVNGRWKTTASTAPNLLNPSDVRNELLKFELLKVCRAW